MGWRANPIDITLMAIAIDEFWVLAIESGLFMPDEARKLAAKFAGIKGAASRSSCTALARWLMARHVLTHYQAKKLAAGHRTKFVYGNFVILERVTSGHLARLLRATHRPSGQEVFLYFRDHDTPRGSQRMASTLQQAVAAAGEVRVIQAASAGCYQWHEVGKSRFFVLEDCGPEDTAWRIFSQWLSPGGTTQQTISDAQAAALVEAADSIEQSTAPTAQSATAASHGATSASQVARVVSPPTAASQPFRSPRMASAVPIATPVTGEGLPLHEQPADVAQPRGRESSPLPDFAKSRPATSNRTKRSPGFWPPPTWMAAVAGATVALVTVAFLFSGGTGLVSSDQGKLTTDNGANTSGQSAPSDTDAGTSASNHTPTESLSADKGISEGATAAIARAENVRAIDEPLWQSPTAGKPLNLAYLPAGVQMVIALRPADLLAHPEAARLLDPRTLGPVSDWFTKDLPAIAGQPLANIDQAIIGLLDGDLIDGKPGPPRVTLVVQLRAGVPENQLVQAWGGPADAKVADRKLFEREGRAWYLPHKDDTRTIVVGPASEIRQVAAHGDAPPALQRELEGLLASSDELRQVTILFAPRYLFTSGRALLAGPAERLKNPLDWFFSGHEASVPADRPPTTDTTSAEMKPADKNVELEAEGLDLAKGAMLSLHLSENLFAELRVAPDLARGLPIIAGEYQQRVKATPKRVDLFIRSLALSPYSYDVLWQFPRMIEQAENYTRVGFDGRQVVLRMVLPAVATHNLALGTRLALLENRRDGKAAIAAAGQTAAAAPAAPPTVAERLKRRISLVFPANTLEKAVQLLSEDLGVPIVIQGADLQLEGITKNQTLRDLNERDQPAGEILRKVMLMANANGKLVYVVKVKEGGGEESLVITTRAAAAKRGDKLPEELNK